MKAAVPMFEDDVAPRFDFTDRILIAKIVRQQIVEWREEMIPHLGWHGRLEAIRDMGVDVLLCCGFNRHFIPLSATLGIRVMTGLGGKGREILERFARGDLSVISTGKDGAKRGRHQAS